MMKLNTEQEVLWKTYENTSMNEWISVLTLINSGSFHCLQVAATLTRKTWCTQQQFWHQGNCLKLDLPQQKTKSWWNWKHICVNHSPASHWLRSFGKEISNARLLSSSLSSSGPTDRGRDKANHKNYPQSIG